MAMEIIPITLDAILQSLKKRASGKQSPVIVQARIAITPDAELLLDVCADQPLETISF